MDIAYIIALALAAVAGLAWRAACSLEALGRAW